MLSPHVASGGLATRTGYRNSSQSFVQVEDRRSGHLAHKLTTNGKAGWSCGEMGFMVGLRNLSI